MRPSSALVLLEEDIDATGDARSPMALFCRRSPFLTRSAMEEEDGDNGGSLPTDEVGDV